MRLVLLAALLVACKTDPGLEGDALFIPWVDAIIYDRPRGMVPHLGVCTESLDCLESTDDCVVIGSSSQCVRRCTLHVDCPFSTFCLPDNTDNLPEQYANLARHCYVSFCGPAFASGETGDACKLGAEVGLTDLAGDPLAGGWCFPESDGDRGACFEAGAVGEGGVCDNQPPLDRARTGQNCTADTFCDAATEEQATGICRQLCDPTLVVDGDETGGCDGGDQCRDVSQVTPSDGEHLPSTIGVCDVDQACVTTAANPCADLPSGDAQGCKPTNPLRQTGVCDPAAGGELAVGSTCAIDGATDSTQCVAGSACVGSSSDGADLRCRALCTLPGGTCASGACVATVWSTGADEVRGTEDDEITQGWGVCE